MKHLLPHQKIIELSDYSPAPADRSAPLPSPLLEGLLGPLAERDADRLPMALQIIEQATPRQLEMLRRLSPGLYAEALASLGEAHLMMGNLAEGRRYLAEALPLRQQAGDSEAEGATLLALARYHDQHGEREAALGYVEELAALALRQGQHNLYMNMMTALYQAHREQGDRERCIRDLNDSLSLLRRMGLKGEEMACLGHLGTEHYLREEYAAARDAFASALPLAVELGAEEEPMLRQRLGQALFQVGDYAAAAEHEEVLLLRTRKAGDLQSVRTQLCDLGVTYHLAEKDADSARCLEEALRIPQQPGQGPPEETIRSNLGAAYLSMKELGRAREQIDQALALMERSGDTSRRYVLLDHLANLSIQEGDLHRAIALHKEALEGARAAGDWHAEARQLLSLGELHEGLGTSRRALEYYRQNLALVTDLSDLLGELGALDRLGQASAPVDPQRALKYFEWMAAIAREAGEPVEQARAMFRLGVARYQQGDRARAEQHMEESLALLKGRGSQHEAEIAKVLAQWREQPASP